MKSDSQVQAELDQNGFALLHQAVSEQTLDSLTSELDKRGTGVPPVEVEQHSTLIMSGTLMPRHRRF